MEYEYECPVCSHGFSAEQSIKDEPLQECPKCRIAALRRVVSGGRGFLLKGSVWAKDGYSEPKGE